MEQLISQLRNSTIYCKIDLYKAYLYVEGDEESRKIQTMSTHKDAFLVNRLSLIIKLAPGLFHKIIDDVLQGLNGVNAYFDDIIHRATLAKY